MTDVNTLIHRIDQEIAAEVVRQKAGWTEMAQANRARKERLQRYETEADRLVALLKPRLDAFIERFEAAVKTEPIEHEHTRALKLTFAATVAQVTLRFAVLPDMDANHVRLESNQEIIPVVVGPEKQSVLEFPLDGVRDRRSSSGSMTGSSLLSGSTSRLCGRILRCESDSRTS